jgi:hypothetical protein
MNDHYLSKELQRIGVRYADALGFQINQPNRCNNFSSLPLDVYLQLMFRAFSRSSSGAQQLQQQPLVLPSTNDHDQQHCYHHAPKVKPEAAAAIVELLMMGVRTPETC